MSTPAQTPPTAPAPETGFDPLVFWVQHQKKIVIFIGLFVVALLIYFGAEFFRTQKATASAKALATANDDGSLRKVMADHAGTNAAGAAYLLLAENQRKASKPDEAVTTLRTFIDKYPEHPLISGAWTSLAATLEIQNKDDEALSAYQKVSTTYAASFSAPVALLGQARIFKRKGKTADAQRLYDQVNTQYAESLFSQQATREARELKK